MLCTQRKGRSHAICIQKARGTTVNSQTMTAEDPPSCAAYGASSLSLRILLCGHAFPPLPPTYCPRRHPNTRAKQRPTYSAPVKLRFLAASKKHDVPTPKMKSRDTDISFTIEPHMVVVPITGALVSPFMSPGRDHHEGSFRVPVDACLGFSTLAYWVFF